MWESKTMNLSESLAASGIGMLVVMLVLVVLAFAIIIVSKILKIIGLGIEKKVAPPVQNASQGEELDEESYAILMAAVCEEIQQPADKFRITEIKEIH